MEEKTPYEAWNGIKPDLSHLRVFECDAYLDMPDEQRTKLEAKSRRCIHARYSKDTTKIWRLWNIAGKHVVRGVNIHFYESSWGGRDVAAITPEVEKPTLEIIDPF